MLVSGVVGSGEDGMVRGMHIGLLRSPETVIRTPLTIIDMVLSVPIVAIISQSVLFTPSNLIILARKVTCPVLWYHRT